MLGRSALLAATNSALEPWQGNYSDVSLLLRNGTPLLVPFDESPTPKTITAVGNASVTTAIAKWNQGSGGSSLAFDGSGDYLQLSSDTNSSFNFDTQDFSVECWFYRASATGRQDLMGRYNTTPTGFGLGTSYAASGDAIWFYGNSAILQAAGASWTAGMWNHIAITRAGTALRMFINSNLVASATDSTNYNAGNPLQIGAAGNTTLFWNGNIDDLRITKGIARYETGTGANAGKMVFAGTNDLALPTTELPANITDDPSYNSVSLLLRNGTPLLLPFDESPTPKTISVVGSPTVNTTLFKYGNAAYEFPGTTGNHYMVSGITNFTPGSGAWTVEAWIYPKSSADWVIMAGSNFYLTRVSSAVYIGDGSVNPIAVASVPDVGVWTHVAAVRESGGTLRLFFDGVQQASSTGSLSTAATTDILIGGRTAGAVVASNALLDDVRITKGVARYTSNFTPPPAQLPANITDDPDYNSVSLLLRNGTPAGAGNPPLDESPTPKTITTVGNASVTTAIARWNQGSGGSSYHLPGGNNWPFYNNAGYYATSASPDLQLTGNFTIEMWINIAGTGIGIGNIDVLINYSVTDVTSNITLYQGSQNNFTIALILNNGRILSSNSVSFNAWNHIAFVRNNSVITVYKNGIADSSLSASDGFLNNAPTIGTQFSSTNWYIDDLRITKGIARYTSNFTPPPAELPNF